MFTGGYDLKAAAAVCVADDLPAGEILDLVSGLVDQSIVIAEDTGTGHTRYRMLTDIRQFGLERAEKDGELHGMQERHATWCAELVSRFDAEAGGPHQPDWLRLLRLEDANLRAALGYLAGSAEGAAAGLVMARKLDLYWSACGLLDEARHWLELALATGAGTPQERALAMAVAARFAVLQHDRIRARELVEEGTEVATAVEDDPGARAAAGAGRHARGLGRHPHRGCRSGRLRSGAPARRVRPARRAAGALRRRGLPRFRRKQCGGGRPASPVHRPRGRGRRAPHEGAGGGRAG